MTQIKNTPPLSAYRWKRQEGPAGVPSDLEPRCDVAKWSSKHALESLKVFMENTDQIISMKTGSDVLTESPSGYFLHLRDMGSEWM